MFKKMLRKFLGIDELESRFTEIDEILTNVVDELTSSRTVLEKELNNISEDLQNNIEETECHRTDLDDRPTFYDMECQVESLVSDWVNETLEDIVERLKKLEDK